MTAHSSLSQKCWFQTLCCDCDSGSSWTLLPSDLCGLRLYVSFSFLYLAKQNLPFSVYTPSDETGLWAQLTWLGPYVFESPTICSCRWARPREGPSKRSGISILLNGRRWRLHEVFSECDPRILLIDPSILSCSDDIERERGKSWIKIAVLLTDPKHVIEISPLSLPFSNRRHGKAKVTLSFPLN